jgi:hypothetical protein
VWGVCASGGRAKTASKVCLLNDVTLATFQLPISTLKVVGSAQQSPPSTPQKDHSRKLVRAVTRATFHELMSWLNVAAHRNAWSADVDEGVDAVQRRGAHIIII